MQKIIDAAEKQLESRFKEIDNIAFLNQMKVLEAFKKNAISTRHFAGTTGYGYDDIGRDTLARLFADVFCAESAIVSPMLTCGSHAISTVLFGLLRPGDLMLSVTGSPYDTLMETIKGSNHDNGSLKDFGVRYGQIDLTSDYQPDYDKIQIEIQQNKPKIVFMQRTRGYSWRPPLNMQCIDRVAKIIKTYSPNSFLVVDNCYGEFVDYHEPTEFGADVIVGSLIKNPGGGLAQTGGYIAGSKRAIDLISSRFTSPSLGLEVGSYEQGYRNYYQGLFLAPHTVAQAIKGSLLIGQIMSDMGFDVFPSKSDHIGDIIQSIKFDTKQQLIDFVRLVQKVSPIDSFVQPEPWAMPGYEDEVIMAAGTFVSGASIELSCDSPIKKPYVAYFQGGLTYEHIKAFAYEILKNKNLFNTF